MRIQHNLKFVVDVQPSIDTYQAYHRARFNYPIADAAYDICISTRTDNSKITIFTHRIRIDLGKVLFDA